MSFIPRHSASLSNRERLLSANVPGALICTAGYIFTVYRTRESSDSVACYQIDMWGVPVFDNVVYDSVIAFYFSLVN